MHTPDDPIFESQKERSIRDDSTAAARQQDMEKVNPGNALHGIRLLVVEDDPVLLDLIARFFAQSGIRADLAADGREALEKLSSSFYDMVFTDLHVPVMDGLSLLDWIKKRHPCTKVVIISGDNTPEKIIMAMRSGALDYLLKPFRMVDLLEVAERCNRRIEPSTQAVLISLIRQLSNDLRGDLANLSIMARRLQGRQIGHMETAVAGQIREMKEKMESMIAIVEDYSNMAVVLARGRLLAEEELDLMGDVILPTIDELTLELARKEIKISPCKSPLGQALVKGNRVLLRGAFRSLLRAALWHCEEEGNISFGISYNGRRFMVNLSDDGPVLPEKQRQYLFDDYLFLSDQVGQRDEQSLGAGLFLARNIVQQHGGDLWYEARNEDSEFILTLPATC